MKNALLMSLSLMALSMPAIAQDNSKNAAAMDLTKAANEMEYRTNLMALGSMSLMASELAEDKASNAEVKKFAAFEVSEQSAIASVLKDMKTQKAPMNEKDQAVMDQLKSASGAEFDRAYLQASQDTHERLEDLGENFLGASKSGEMKEQHARHLATVTLPTIKQHITQSKELMATLK